MATELIANANATFKQSTSSGASGGVITSIPPITLEKAGGAKIFSKEIKVILAGSVSAAVSTCVQSAPVDITIDPALGRLCKSAGELIMLKGDKNLIPVTVNGNDSAQMGAACTYTATVEVDDPGTTATNEKAN